MWAIGNAYASGADPRETYAHTENWCQTEGGSLPAGSWPREPRAWAERAPRRLPWLAPAARSPGRDWRAGGRTVSASERPRWASRSVPTKLPLNVAVKLPCYCEYAARC